MWNCYKRANEVITVSSSAILASLVACTIGSSAVLVSWVTCIVVCRKEKKYCYKIIL